MRYCFHGHWLSNLALSTALLIFPAMAAQALPVIPGAVGFGMNTPAGRGGDIYRVTNLNDSGNGSLRECVDASGPRVCIFEVSGTIHLHSDLHIDNPRITIAGQTAPSPGITIRGAALWVRNSDVLIQHLRLRSGDDRQGPDPDNRNSLRISSGQRSLENVVVAHNSISWGVDQLSNVYADNVTFHKNIFSEALHDSLHSKGPHSKGPLFRDTDPFGKPVRATLYGNLIAHNEERNPLSKAAEFVFVNNVIYNWGGKATDLQGGNIPSLSTLIGNYYKPGANSNLQFAIMMRGRGSSDDMKPGSKVYVEDNITPTFDGSDPWSAVHMEQTLDNSFRASSRPVWHQGLEAMPAEDAFEWVLEVAGARPADRDSVDERVVQEVRDGNGRLIDSTSQIGGWPSLAENRRELEIPSNPHSDSNGNGYTNLEEWLHQMAAEVEGQALAAPRPPAGLSIR